MKKKNKPLVVITGSAGTIGSALRAALEHEYQVVGMDREGTTCDINIDLTSTPSIDLAFKIFKEKYNKKIAAVIHLAAYFDFTGEESPLYQEVNVNGTKKLLKKLQDFDVDRFIFSSTMLVHQPCQLGDTINEDSPIKPKWAYPKSKEKTEKIIQKHHKKIPYLILRLAGVYDDSSCVPTLAQQIVRIYERSIKSHLYAGDSQAGQSFIHLLDLVNLFKKSIKYRNDLPKEEIILAGEREAVSYQKLQMMIYHLIHAEEHKIKTIPTSIAKVSTFIEEKFEPLIPDDFDHGETPFIRPFMIDMASDHYALDITKAHKLLHWEPEHRIKDSLPIIIEFLKNDPKTWYENHKITMPDWMTAVKDQDLDKMRVSNEKKFRKEHQQTLWAHFLNISLGFWLITSPFILGYSSSKLTISDMVSGILIIVFGLLCLSWRFAVGRLICASIGVWLLFAPLIFWAPTAAAYLNDTLVGALVIGFSILVLPEIGIAPNARLEGPNIPPGWDFSPSSWTQRLPIIFLAFIGLYISRYMAAYQLGHIDHVWDPFFNGNPHNVKNGTEEIITSYLSTAWPVPDAGLGATVYLLEIITGIIGRANRWRTMPWLVLFFGFMIIPLGVVSITFIIIQPILLNTWCTLCLIAAVAMLLQIPYSFDEIVASSLFLWRRWKAGRPVLRILFVGDTDKITKKEKKIDDFEQSPGLVMKEIFSGGITFPWNLILSLFVGIWLMFTRITLGTTNGMANADHLIGALLITITITAFSEVMRPIRFLNFILAICLLVTPFIYGATLLVTLVSWLCGIVLFILTLPRGKITNTYGEWDKFIV